MKKMILGLFLTVGISTMSFANENNNKPENKDVDKEKFLSKTCYEQTIINKENHCGVYIGTENSPVSIVQCEEGQGEGTTTTYYWTWKEPTPQQAHICECSH